MKLIIVRLFFMVYATVFYGQLCLASSDTPDPRESATKVVPGSTFELPAVGQSQASYAQTHLASVVENSHESTANNLLLAIQAMTFPRSYHRMWRNAAAEAKEAHKSELVFGARALLAEYRSSRFMFHWRDFTNSPGFLDILEAFESDAIATRMDILVMLSMLRLNVFSEKYSSDFYGVQEVRPNSSSRTLVIGEKHYKRICSEPDSLYARARYILLMTLVDYWNEAEQDGAKELNNIELSFLGDAIGYYLQNPLIALDKKSTSLLIKATESILALGCVAASGFLGPLIGHAMHFCGLEVCHHASHWITHPIMHLVQSSATSVGGKIIPPGASVDLSVCGH